MTRLPVEILRHVLELYVAAHINEMVGPHADATEDEEDDDTGTTARDVVARPIVSCLLSSYQFREITLEILSRYFGIPLDRSGDRLESSPWPRLAAVRAFVLTGSRTGTIVAELVSIARASPTLGVYIFEKAARYQLGLAPRTYNIDALTIDYTNISLAKIQWDDAWFSASRACEQVPLAPLMIQPVLQGHAHGTLVKTTLARRYGTLLTMLVRGVQVLHLFHGYDTRRSEGDFEYLSMYLPRFLQMLRQVEGETLPERKHEADEGMVMPQTHTVTDLCTVLQKVVDIDVPESEVYGACHTLACSLKEDFEQRLLRTCSTV